MADPERVVWSVLMYLGPIWRILVGMHTGERWRLGHRPGLDGLRAVAVLMVVAAHFDQGQVTLGGVMGVTVFFTLSGFLITSLLLAEHEKTGRIDRWAFYRRRALRLFPALAVMLAMVCLLTAGGFPTDVRPGMVASVVGYVSNWFLMGTRIDGVTQWGALGHTWSLAIEEQFYIVWPLLVILLARRGRRAVFWMAAGGAAASMVWALVSGRPNLATDVSAYPLLVGCALAAWMHGRGVVRPAASWALVALAPIVAFLAVGVSAREVAYVVVPLATAALVFVVVQRPVGWLQTRPLVWVGKRSYGLYLWHVPVSYLCLHVAVGPRFWWPVAAVGIAASFGLTALSWRYVEQPFLRLKDRGSATDPAPTLRGRVVPARADATAVRTRVAAQRR